MAERSRPIQISGVFPHLCLGAELSVPRTECGVGAPMPWADRLWAVTYVSSKSKSGAGTGLYEIDEEFRIVRRPESYVGTYTNRFVRYESNQMIIGPWVIDAKRNVRTVEPLLEVRTCSTMKHLDDPENKQPANRSELGVNRFSCNRVYVELIYPRLLVASLLSLLLTKK